MTHKKTAKEQNKDECKTESFFLPYQIQWLDDKSRVKIWEKSRRIGATYVQAYEDVYDALNTKIRNKPCTVWFSSADESAAKEYIQYCQDWAKMFNAAVQVLGEIIIDEKKDIKALSLEFKNGARINALSSNPKGFRSKGGKVILDEFAFHSDQNALWKAAKPCITWGYPLRILSTHNGQNCLYYRFLKKCKEGKLNWGFHSTPIQLAVKQGLVDKIYDRPTTDEEREQWIEEERKDCADEVTWQQEYCCCAIDETTAFLSYELINNCCENCLKEIEDLGGELYVGMDIGRKKDLSVITVIEKLDSVKYLRKIIELPKMPFREQKLILYAILQLPNVRRGCLDATGIGMQMSEDAQKDFGKYRIEPVMFTGKSKEEMAYQLLTAFEDRNVRIPDDEVLKDDLHSVKRVMTQSNNVRFDVEASETDGHADRFWSLALANHAATTKNGAKAEIRSRSARRKKDKIYEHDYSPIGGVLRLGMN